MKLTKNDGCGAGEWKVRRVGLAVWLLWLGLTWGLCGVAGAQAVSTTTVQGRCTWRTARRARGH